MTITRAAVEASLVARASRKMALVDFSIVTDGTNTDLNDPMATALRKMGLVVAAPTVADSDLVGLDDQGVDELIDRAELRLLENILGNYDLTSISLGGRTENLNQIADGLEKAITRKAEQVRRAYGDGSSTLEAGSIILDSQSKMDAGTDTWEWPL